MFRSNILSSNRVFQSIPKQKFLFCSSHWINEMPCLTCCVEVYTTLLLSRKICPSDHVLVETRNDVVSWGKLCNLWAMIFSLPVIIDVGWLVYWVSAHTNFIFIFASHVGQWTLTKIALVTENCIVRYVQSGCYRWSKNSNGNIASYLLETVDFYSGAQL